MGDSLERIGLNHLNHKLKIRRGGLEVVNGNISGSSAATGSFGRVEGRTDFTTIDIDNDEIPIAKLASDNVNFGGVTVTLGASDTTPAFDLSDATAYTGDSSLVTTGTVTSGIWNSSFGSTTNTTISGSFTAVSSSLASRLTTEEGEAEGSVISSSAQLATDISGSFTAASSSFSTRVTTEEGNVDTLQSTMTSEQTNIDNLQTDSGSFSTRVTGLKTDSGSFSTRVTTEEGNVDTLQSTMTSEQTNIDNLQTDSGSFSTRTTTLETTSSALAGTGTVQGVGTTNAVTFATVDTGQGANELYDMDQNVKTDSAVTFATVDTGQGANELYDMDQNVKTDSTVTFATVDTGQGANELYDMDQNVLTTSSPTFAAATITGTLTATEVHTQYISASITKTTGSNVFGDAADDTHQFTGSLLVSSSLSGSAISTGSFGRVEAITIGGTLSTAAQPNITSVGTISTGTWEGTTVAVDQGGTGATSLNDLITLTTHTTGNYVGTITGGTNLTSTAGTTGEGTTHTLNVDDSFLVNDASDTTSGTITAAGLITSGNISGSSTSTGSFGRVEASTVKGTLATAAQTNITSIGTITTGVWNSSFGSTTNTTISGSFTAVSSSLASRLTIEEAEAEGTVLSSSAQIATDISGSFTSVSSSLASRITSEESDFTAAGISGSIVSGVSGSAISTGSFGRLEGNGEGITNVAAVPFLKTGSMYAANSDIQITGSLSVSGTISGSYSGLSVGQKFKHSQTTAASTWTISHGFNYQYVNVDIYDDNDQIIIPTTVTATDANTLTVTFNTVVAGVAIISTGGQARDELGKNVIFNQSAAATNWRVTHSIGEQYPAVTVYDENDNVIIPERINAADASKMDIIFTEAVSGNVNISVGGGQLRSAITGSEQLSFDNFGDISGSVSSTGSFGRLEVVGVSSVGVLTATALTATTLDTGQGANELYDMDQNVLTTSSPTFAAATITGTLTATEVHTQYVSSSITVSSGSNTFGDAIDDLHSFTGSLSISGSGAITAHGNVSSSISSTGSFGRAEVITLSGTTLYGTVGTAAQNSITSATSLASVGTVTAGVWNSTFGSTANITISGSFTALSSSLASRLTSEEVEAEGSVVSSSAQLAAEISGSFISVSSSLAGRIATNATNITSLNADIIALSIALG